MVSYLSISKDFQRTDSNSQIRIGMLEKMSYIGLKKQKKCEIQQKLVLPPSSSEQPMI